MLEVPDWGLTSWKWFGYGHWFLLHLYFKFWFSTFIFQLQRNPCPLKPHLGLWRMLEVSDRGLASWSRFGYVTGLWYNHDLNFSSLSCVWSCKEHECPLSPYLGLWRRLEVPEWGLASWSLFGYCCWSLILLLQFSRNKIRLAEEPYQNSLRKDSDKG